MTATAALLPEQRAYQPHGVAVEAIRCRDREVLFHGPVRTGKSVAFLTKLFILAEKYDGMRALLLRQTRESLTETALQTWEDEVVPLGHAILTGAKRNIRQAYHFPNGSEVVVGGMDNPRKIMSSEYDIIYIPEATDLAEDDFMHLTTRNARYHMPYNQILMDCNPQQPSHWLKRRMDAGMTTGFQARFRDNPKYWDMEKDDWTVPAGVELAATLDRMPPMLRKRLRDGEWVAAEGAVYDIFDTDLDTIAPIEIPDDWRRFVGLDFGGANTAALFYAEDPENDDLYLYREYHAGGRTAGQHAHFIRMGEPNDLFVVGGAPSEDDRRMEFLAAGMLVHRPKIKDVALGISRVYGQHKRHAIKVFNTCAGYLAQKADYRYKKDALIPGEIEAKNTYHYMDSERYVIGYIRGARSGFRHHVSGRAGVATASEA